jgi:hypothetical protein
MREVLNFENNVQWTMQAEIFQEKWNKVQLIEEVLSIIIKRDRN